MRVLQRRGASGASGSNERGNAVHRSRSRDLEPEGLTVGVREGGMERFVRLIVAGGIALVGGLWFVAVFEPWSIAWAAGAALAVLGTGGLVAGIASEIDP
jgi:hypothetical protein